MIEDDSKPGTYSTTDTDTEVQREQLTDCEVGKILNRSFIHRSITVYYL